MTAAKVRKKTDTRPFFTIKIQKKEYLMKKVALKFRHSQEKD